MTTTTAPPTAPIDTQAESPLAHLSEEQLEQLAQEFDAIRDRVMGELGDRDRRYIESMIEMQRRLAVLGRLLLLASRNRGAWTAGTAALSAAKILENMEIGHNVMHGQWDWMNDPRIHSSTWDWDTASTAEAWKHSHNFVHHTYTNIRGKDKDLGYEIMRIDPAQKWNPVYLAQPIYNLILMALFEWGVALHDLDFEAIRKGHKPMHQVKRELKGMAGKARTQITKDYIAFPVLSGLISTGIDLALGAANIEGGPLFHVISGNLGYQVEHHIYPDMPSTRYGEIAPRVREICERYELPYNTGPFLKQLGMVQRTILRLAFPGGKPRPKPGPYKGDTIITSGERDLQTAAAASSSNGSS